MNFEAQRIQQVDVDCFSIPIGSRVIIEPSGVDGKIRTFFIGMERKSYFIVSLAPMMGAEKRIYDFLYKGNRTKIFYTSDGVINGFIAKILLYTTSPFRHIYFTYPTDAEICNLRKSPRTDCHLPTKLSVGDMHFSGMMQNISSSGCGVCIQAPHPELAEDIQKNALASLRFYLVKNMKEFFVQCRVMNLRKQGNKLILGLSFLEMEESLQRRVNEFINWVLTYRA